MHALGCIMALTLAAGFAPLSQTQQRQLASASDGGAAVDEGALYPLLRNVGQWEAGKLAGARVPNYEAIKARPGEHRGGVYLIEGHFVRQRRLQLNRAGPWDEAVTEWAVRVSDEPNRRYVIVFFVDPDNSMPPPTKGDKVRLAARFYKVWGTHNKRGAQKNWLTFVARSATVSSSSGGTTLGTGAWLAAGFTLLAIVGLALVMTRVRGWQRKPAGEGPGLGKRGYAARQRRQARGESAEDRESALAAADASDVTEASEVSGASGGSVAESLGAADPDQTEPASPLPDEPDEALANLAQKHEAASAEGASASQPADAPHDESADEPNQVDSPSKRNDGRPR
jgi:hypothetical protein